MIRPMHAARNDYDEPFFCEVHEIEHMNDICPQCHDKDNDREICEKHGLWVLDDVGCERCDEEYQDRLSQEALSQDWTTWIK